jgi:hypothetical protein
MIHYIDFTPLFKVIKHLRKGNCFYPVKENAQSFFLNKKSCDQFQANKNELFKCFFIKEGLTNPYIY